MATDSLPARIGALLESQLQGVLATQQEAQPYTSLMAYVHTPDLRHLVFATYRETQKHANLLINSRVSFLVDSRCNAPIDYEQAIAISASGFASTIPEGERAGLLDRYLRKHPPLRDFVTSPDCALLRIDVVRYLVVSRFQAVEVLTMAGAVREQET